MHLGSRADGGVAGEGHSAGLIFPALSLLLRVLFNDGAKGPKLGNV
jgi:hypothetical protein